MIILRLHFTWLGEMSMDYAISNIKQQQYNKSANNAWYILQISSFPISLCYIIGVHIFDFMHLW